MKINQIVLRLSRVDPNDPTCCRRRHFEISIDSPFNVLNCRATQANLNLPQYAGVDPPIDHAYRRSCGCPDAPYIDHMDSPSAPYVVCPTATAAAATSTSSSESEPRPIHLMRVPSYNPPPFDADCPPPTLSPILGPQPTPPPRYDVVVGTPSVDGLADYFARLANYRYDAENSTDDDEDDDSGGVEDTNGGGAKILTTLTDRLGRVNIANPRTPGFAMAPGARAAPSRSLEIVRPTINLSTDMLPRLRQDV